MPNLEKLGLDQTGMISVPTGMFYNNLKLKELNVSGNYLISFDESIIYNLKDITVLDLSANYINGLDQSFFDALKDRSKFQMVYLQVKINNSVICLKTPGSIIEPKIYFRNFVYNDGST